MNLEILGSLPDINALERRMKALATLDALLCEDWEDRYYSFDASWSDGETMGSMNDGCGDHFFIHFSKVGAAIVGLAHEAPGITWEEPWPWLYADLPAAFEKDFLNEPAFETKNATFCAWRLADADAWSCGRSPHGDIEDGSAELLEILTTDHSGFLEYANDYYEDEVEDRPIDPEAVAAIYALEPLTPELAARINPDCSLEDLQEDLTAIGYPIG